MNLWPIVQTTFGGHCRFKVKTKPTYANPVSPKFICEQEVELIMHRLLKPERSLMNLGSKTVL